MNKVCTPTHTHTHTHTHTYLHSLTRSSPPLFDAALHRAQPGPPPPTRESRRHEHHHHQQQQQDTMRGSMVLRASIKHAAPTPTPTATMFSACHCCQPFGLCAGGAPLYRRNESEQLGRQEGRQQQQRISSGPGRSGPSGARAR